MINKLKDKIFNRKAKISKVQLDFFRVRKIAAFSIWGIWGLLLILAVINTISPKTVTVREELKGKAEIFTDSSGIESFAKSFINAYFSWSGDNDSKAKRQEELGTYLTDELLKTSSQNVENVGSASEVRNSAIFAIDKNGNDYEIKFSVTRIITQSQLVSEKTDFFNTTIHKEADQYVVVRSPSLTSSISKSDYAPEVNGDLTNIAEIDRIQDFFNTFFKIYPQSTDKELAFYGTNIPAINQDLEMKDVRIVELSDTGGEYRANVSVVYVDNTGFQTLNQYRLEIQEQNENFVITKFN